MYVIISWDRPERRYDNPIATMDYDQLLYLVECYNTLAKRGEIPNGLTELPPDMSRVIDDLNAELAA